MQRGKSHGSQIDPNDLVDRLIKETERRARVEGQLEAEQRLVQREEENRQLVEAVSELAKKADAPDAPQGIPDALRRLEGGKTEAAEAIFQQVLDQKRAGGEAAEAAAAARHIGALAYLHDTQKALSAYAQAVELDAENPDGWNMLGLLPFDKLRVRPLCRACRSMSKYMAES